MKTLRTFVTASLLVCLVLGGTAQAKTVRLLTIGNSFSANATKFLGKLAEAGGHTLVHGPVVVGGASMELHSGRALANANDPKDKAGLYTNGRSLVQELEREKWDFVTIQQASIKSHDLSTYQPHAGRLRDLIQKHAPTARLLVHQTWEYRVDDPRFTKPSGKPGEPATQDAMYQMLTSAYKTLTQELGARRIPVGDAFHLVDNDPVWAFKPDTTFDPKAAKNPAQPDQKNSLHMGWQWKKQKDGRVTLVMDGHHANPMGEYLGGCVFYEVLFGESPVGNKFLLPGMDPAYALFLQETAHKVVLAAQAETEAGTEAAGTSKPKDSAFASPAEVEAIQDLVAFWDFQDELRKLASLTPGTES